MLIALGGPFEKRIESRAKCLTPVGQAVFDLGRDLMMNDAANDPVGFHLAKLLDQHLLRDRRDRALQLGESKHLSAKQMEKDHELPSPFQNLERLLDAARSGDRRVLFALTSR